MPLKSSLTRLSGAGRALLDELHLLGSTFDPDDHYELPARLVTAAKRLGPIERATVRVSIPPERPSAELPFLIESAALRLAIWDANGVLPRLSGTELARNLQEVSAPTLRGSGLRRAAWGFAMLAALDTCGCASITVETLAIEGRYERARLSHVITGIMQK